MEATDGPAAVLVSPNPLTCAAGALAALMTSPLVRAYVALQSEVEEAMELKKKP
ncbi:hypothetical protein QJS10_CPB18g01276 [Acorus calamus]|uniref:Uncharacterized protein n=1 Tax=Acorus calamus TaxID=4465 RepID=A0AAV9CLZ6_ACOCL|nr:hypothetical protein QJS10_CPB18g01276 [Acorus calamus]